MDQVSIKYTNILHYKTLQNLPKFGFLVWKQTIWQPWDRAVSVVCRLARENWKHFLMIWWYRLCLRRVEHLGREVESRQGQGCQVVYFQTKNPNVGKRWRLLQWKLLVYFMTFGLFYGHFLYILWSFGILGGNLVNSSRFGMFYQEKSGNLVRDVSRVVLKIPFYVWSIG
jgi:hypothetical protein